MSCENTERNNKEWYIKDFRKAILLKFKSATSPSPDIKTETDKESARLYRKMSDYTGKTVKTIIKEVDEKFGEEWEKETKDKFRKSESLYAYRQKKYREVQTMLNCMDK